MGREKNGYDRLRISVIDLTQKPNFTKNNKFKMKYKITFQEAYAYSFNLNADFEYKGKKIQSNFYLLQWKWNRRYRGI